MFVRSSRRKSDMERVKQTGEKTRRKVYEGELNMDGSRKNHTSVREHHRVEVKKTYMPMYPIQVGDSQFVMPNGFILAVSCLKLPLLQ